MAIPDNIRREHIFQAIIRIINEGVPIHRDAEKYVMIYEEKPYPCKLLISWANVYVNHFELDPDPKIFNTTAAQAYLKKLGFTSIINLKTTNS